MSDNKKATVIGGGFGGLSVAASLQNRGFDVQILEKHDTVGGVARTIESDSFKFDFGPSWYLMPEVFERFFQQFDSEPSDYYDLVELDPQFRVFWKDTDFISFPSRFKKQKRLFEAYEKGAGEKFEQYMEESEEAYNLGMERFIYENRSSLKDFLDWDVIRSVKALGLFRESMQDHVSKYFKNPKLQQLMLYNIVFLGGTPSMTPALYKLMSHATLKGVYYPIGGMSEVVDAYIQVSEKQGVSINTGVEVVGIKGSRGNFRVETDEKSYESDIVVSNVDYQYTESELVEGDNRQYDEEYWDDTTYGPSAFLLYLGVDNELQRLSHHSLVFPEDWTEHFDSIRNGGLPENPAYYMNVPSDTDDSLAPDGKSVLTVLVPISSGSVFSQSRKDEFEKLVIDDIETNTRQELADDIVYKKRVCVSEFMNDFNRSEGTALGISHTPTQTSILRANTRSKSVDGLYFVGGDTRPGIGVPMCTIGGMNVAETISKDEKE